MIIAWFCAGCFTCLNNYYWSASIFSFYFKYIMQKVMRINEKNKEIVCQRTGTRHLRICMLTIKFLCCSSSVHAWLVTLGKIVKPILTTVLHHRCATMVSVRMASITLLVTAMLDILEGFAMSILMTVRVGTPPLTCALTPSVDFSKTSENHQKWLGVNKINKARLKKTRLFVIRISWNNVVIQTPNFLNPHTFKPPDNFDQKSLPSPRSICCNFTPNFSNCLIFQTNFHFLWYKLSLN